ncbi:Hypothetical predicted protein [Octopus vulgaris]|uniref:Uncharacterized protein n=1 Tax=Octopus vulgaris TaxID=6645 RepID=A0AA36EYR4_OCTVU|nr:Hypothetical predicted protein [Octopus vulgaris]
MEDEMRNEERGEGEEERKSELEQNVLSREGKRYIKYPFLYETISKIRGPLVDVSRKMRDIIEKLEKKLRQS